MQKKGFIRICLITALITAGAIVLYEISDQLLVYRYFSYQYYVAGVAIAALAAGILLTNHYYKTRAPAVQQPNIIDRLTAKELRILGQIANGCSNKEIAALNYVELSTVKTHINNIYAKLGVKNRKDAAIVHQTIMGMQKSTLSPPAVI